MVTPAYIRGLREDAVWWQPIDVRDIEERMLIYLAENLPEWNRDADSLLRRAVALIAQQVQVFDEERLAQSRRGFLAYATGADLALLGLGPPPVIRLPDETDDEYRDRIADAALALSLGSLAHYEARARALEPEIADALAVVAQNRQDIVLYARDGQGQPLDDAARERLTQALNARDSIIAGAQLRVGAATDIAYTIDIEATYDAGKTDGADLTARMRQGIYDWLGGQGRLGEPIYRSAIQRAAWVEGVLDIDLKAPAKDLAPPSLTFAPASDDPGIGAAGYVLGQPTAPTGTGHLSSVQLTDVGQGYQTAPTATVADDAGQTLALPVTIEDGAVKTVTIPSPQTLDWYGYATDTWCARYVCPATAAGVTISATPRITPSAAELHLAELPATLSITAASAHVAEGADVQFTIALSAARLVDIIALVDVTVTGDIGIEAGRREVRIPSGQTAATLTLPTDEAEVAQSVTVAATLRPSGSSYAISATAGAASTDVGAQITLYMFAQASGSSIRRGADAVWQIFIANYGTRDITLPSHIGLSFLYDVEEGVAAGETGHIVRDTDQLGSHVIDVAANAQTIFRNTPLTFLSPDTNLPTTTLHVRIPTAADGPTGTLALLVTGGRIDPPFILSTILTRDPIGITVQL